MASQLAVLEEFDFFIFSRNTDSRIVFKSVSWRYKQGAFYETDLTTV